MQTSAGSQYFLSKKRLSSIGIMFFCTVSSLGWGWELHGWITRAAVSAHLESKNLGSVIYIPLEKALARLKEPHRFDSINKFMRHYKWHPDFKFKNIMNEKENTSFSAVEILSEYSTESDWGCDQNLFEKNIYPQLWTEDTAYTSEPTGLGSQGFRHQYFSGNWKFFDPLTTFQIPMRPIGEAPERAIMLLKLSNYFFEAKMDYWGYRFLAWSLHFIQDMFQPFHVTQVPHFEFIAWSWKGWLPAIDVEKSVSRVSINHGRYESWVEELAKTSLEKELVYPDTTPLNKQDYRNWIEREIVDFSRDQASVVGKITVQCLPAREVMREKKSVPPFLPDCNEVKPLTMATSKLFRKMGSVVRAWVFHQK